MGPSWFVTSPPFCPKFGLEKETGCRQRTAQKGGVLEIATHAHRMLEAACWDSQADKQSTSTTLGGPKTGSRNRAESKTASTYR